jgi:hypothetical protein
MASVLLTGASTIQARRQVYLGTATRSDAHKPLCRHSKGAHSIPDLRDTASLATPRLFYFAVFRVTMGAELWTVAILSVTFHAD